MKMPLESRIQRLNEMVDEGLIIRNDWVGADEQGRETACLLAALAPEVGEAETASACPAEVMPLWLAHLTPWMDDNCSDTKWPRVIRRYAACANQWHTLDEASWRRVEISARRAAVEEAMRHTTDEQVLASCRVVLDWLDADMPESSHAVKAREVAKVARAAWAAARQAACAAACAAAVEAPWAAAEAAEAAAWAAAAWAVRAAADTAAVEAAADTAAVEAAESAKDEAADRIVDAILSALEQECGMGARG